MASKAVTASIALALIVGAGAFSAYYFSATSQPATSGPCKTLGGDKPLKSLVGSSTFGAITEYRLPGPGRLPNAVAVAQDGSVWFGEQSVPGVGHLFGNGTLVEYPWPTASHPLNDACGYETGIWGIALWNGMVWGTNGDQDALVGFNPQSGAARTINISGSTTFPYVFSTSPDGSLWFTALGNSPVLGRIATDYSVSVIPLSGLGKEFPTQIDFVNSSYAYFVALDPSKNTGGLFSFDPTAAPATITPRRVGGDFPLASPDSVAHGNGIVWIAQHGPSSLAAFDTRSGNWTIFPTSRVNFTSTTLPYFVSFGGGKVWFNEHQGNRIGVIDPSKWTMTEYSEANPPVVNGSAIGNDLTVALAERGLWFTSTTGNYIGFLDDNQAPSFSLSIQGGNSLPVRAGGQLALQFAVDGNWRAPLSVVASDSETYSSVPKLISITPSVSQLSPGPGPAQFNVQVSASSGLTPGRYTLDITVSDGLVLRTVFVFLNVS